MPEKKVIAVIFGGRSVEHDVSVLTGLQCLDALDDSLYEGLPVYIDPLGHWWTGDALKKRSGFPLGDTSAARRGGKDLIPVRLDLALTDGRGQLTVDRRRFIGRRQEVFTFDFAIPAIHGTHGEDGSLQGLLDFVGIPYAGCSMTTSALTMDKAETIRLMAGWGLPVLPTLTIDRPLGGGTFISPDDIELRVKEVLGDIGYPLIVKPRRLGSSVGVSKVINKDGLTAALMTVFRFDNAAILQPCVTPLAEYNVAVRLEGSGKYTTSAIERPLGTDGVLDFADKYRGGGDGAPKQTGGSGGMADQNRVLNPPELTKEQEALIRSAATTLGANFKLAGSTRVDFLCNTDSGEIFVNEVNTVPGSFAFFLWEAAERPLSFLSLTQHIIDEGLHRHKEAKSSTDVAASGARLLQAG